MVSDFEPGIPHFFCKIVFLLWRITLDGGSMFLQQLINGLSLGSIYALIALGYTMVYGIVKLINFAHGDVMMLGAYAGYFVLRAMGANFAGMTCAFLAAMIFCGLFSLVIERFAYRPRLRLSLFCRTLCAFFLLLDLTRASSRQCLF